MCRNLVANINAAKTLTMNSMCGLKYCFFVMIMEQNAEDILTPNIPSEKYSLTCTSPTPLQFLLL